MPRRDYSKVAFAATGDTNSIPTATQPDGSVSLQQGYGFDYQRDNGAGGGTPDPLAKDIGREDMNGIFNEITASIGEIQQNGFPLWASTAAPYPVNSWVRRLDLVYMSVITNNSAAPEAIGSGWVELSALIAGRRIGTRVVSVSGTFTPTAGAKFFRVRLQGAGGGGGGCPATGASQGACAGGGGGGAYCESWLSSAQIGAAIAVTIGVGGNGGFGVQGLSGTASSVGSIMTAPGGFGGNVTGVIGTAIPAISYGGNGGSVATGGNVTNTNGITGLIGYQVSGAVGGSGGGAPIAGGGGGGSSNVPAAFVGAAGASPGAGGGGTASTQSQGNKTGGQGANGVCIIDEYF